MNIKEITQKLSEIDFSKNSDNDVRNLIMRISNQFLLLPLITLNKDQLIYRARNLDKDEAICCKEEELSYIPSILNTKYKRASTPYNTMFYGISAESLNGALAGCLSETCDCLRNFNSQPMSYRVVISSWRLSQDLNVLILPNIDTENKSSLFNHISKEYPNVISSHKLIPNNTDVIDFLKLINKEFTKKVDYESEYWISSIFTEIILSLKNYDGIMYESNQTVDPNLNEVYCLALTPKCADLKLSFEKADIYSFDYKNIDNPIILKKGQQLDIVRSK